MALYKLFFFGGGSVGGWVDELMTLERRHESHPPTPVKSGENVKRDGAGMCSGKKKNPVHRLLAFARSINTLMHAKIGLNRRASVGPDTVL